MVISQNSDLHLCAELLFGGDVFGLVGLGLSLEVGAQVATMLVHRRRRVLASGERDDPWVHQNVDGRVASLPVDDQQPRDQVLGRCSKKKRMTDTRDVN